MKTKWNYNTEPKKCVRRTVGSYIIWEESSDTDLTLDFIQVCGSKNLRVASKRSESFQMVGSEGK